MLLYFGFREFARLPRGGRALGHADARAASCTAVQRVERVWLEVQVAQRRVAACRVCHVHRPEAAFARQEVLPDDVPLGSMCIESV